MGNDSLEAFVRLNLRVKLAHESSTDDSVAESNAHIPYERPPGYAYRVQRQQERRGSRIGTLWNFDPCAVLEELDDLVEDFPFRLRYFVDPGKGRVENGPVKPSIHLMTTDGRPRGLAEPMAVVGFMADQDRLGENTHHVLR